jgi:hypothetical protein
VTENDLRVTLVSSRRSRKIVVGVGNLTVVVVVEADDGNGATNEKAALLS